MTHARDDDAGTPPAIDPVEFLRRALGISPADAASVREDSSPTRKRGATEMHVRLIEHDKTPVVVIARWDQEAWDPDVDPQDEYTVDGAVWAVKSHALATPTPGHVTVTARRAESKSEVVPAGTGVSEDLAPANPDQ